jgi:hypothetical protein
MGSPSARGHWSWIVEFVMFPSFTVNTVIMHFRKTKCNHCHKKSGTKPSPVARWVTFGGNSKEIFVKFIRQVLLAISIGGIVATVLRTRGKSPEAPSQGGWREVTPQR